METVRLLLKDSTEKQLSFNTHSNFIVYIYVVERKLCDGVKQPL